MAKVIMIQGTMSNAGKSFLVAGLCRIFKQDGWRVAPFKSQNMALNSYITKEGLEMGRAQVMQAEAAGIEPLVCMNPILLKPTSHTGSQVIVNGEVRGNLSARDYFAHKTELIPEIKARRERGETRGDRVLLVVRRDDDGAGEGGGVAHREPNAARNAARSTGRRSRSACCTASSPSSGATRAPGRGRAPSRSRRAAPSTWRPW